MSTPQAQATPDTRDAAAPTAAADTTRAPDASAALERVRRVVMRGLKAAGLTAGGVAAGAALESRAHLWRKLPIARRPSRRQTIRAAIAKRLP
jgi:hypothetical protein